MDWSEIDGTTASEGELLFITASNGAILDEAVMRPGRMDYELEFKPAVREQMVRVVQRFYSGRLDPTIGTIAENVADVICNSWAKSFVIVGDW